MPSIDTLKKFFDKMTPEEVVEHIRKLRDSRKITKKIKKEHTIKGKRETKSAIKKRFDKMSDEERAALIAMLKE